MLIAKFPVPFYSKQKRRTNREAAIWQSIFLQSFFCASKKSVAVQHAMLVGFLALLCPHKEVHLRYVKNLKGVQGEFLYKPQDKLTILYYNKKLDTEDNEGDNYVRNLLF